MEKKRKVEFTTKEVLRSLKKEWEVKLRAFSLSDLDRIMEIERFSFTVDKYTKSQFEELYEEHPEGFFVAEIFGKVVGYVIGYITDDTGEIDSIAVDPNFRQLGIGRKLTMLILKQFKRRRIKLCSLEVRTKNESAIRFYKNIGFQIKEELKHFYKDGGDAYSMEMDLNRAKRGIWDQT